MKHVDEGTLHAYLDGAIDALVEAGALPRDTTRTAIEAHLAGCADCRALLEAERAVRDGATDILAGASPSVDVPPFEAVVGPPAPVRRSARRTLPLAWAASIVMAVGVGWWGSDYVAERRLLAPPGEMLQGDAALPATAPEGGSSARETEQRPAVQSMQAASETSASASVAEPGAADAPPSRTDIAATSAPRAGTGRAESNDATKAEDVMVQAVSAGAAVADAAARERTAARPDVAAGDARVDSAAGRPRVVAGLGVAPDSAGAQRRIVAGGMVSDSAVARALADSTLRTMQGRPLQEVVVTGAVNRGAMNISALPPPAAPAVPDLAVARMLSTESAVSGGRVVWTESAEAEPLARIDGLDIVRLETGTVDGGPVARVVQRLESGDTVELIAWRDAGAGDTAGTRPEQAREAAGVLAPPSVLVTSVDFTGKRRLIARLSGGTFVLMRASLPDAELRALVALLRER